MNNNAAPCVVWRICDGKPGHDNQSRGLLHALNRRVPLHIHTLAAYPEARALRHWLFGRFPAGEGLPDPALIIGCGHRTHIPMLAARRARGGRIILLMKPSLPLRCFDLCIAPEHDNIGHYPNVLTTRGVLNVIAPASRKQEKQGLILLGGPSRHHGWSQRAILEQIDAIAARARDWRWTVVTSPRTPVDLAQALADLRVANVTRVAHTDTGPEWLPYRLAEAERVWVTEDSVSMVYEALTAGAGVGLLGVPRLDVSRVSRGLATLIENGWVMPFASWIAGGELQPTSQPFNEAERCAQWIHEQWLSGH